VDCSDYTEFEYEEVNDYFIHNPDEARGKLTNDDIQAIHALLGSPENNISRKRKLKFGF